MSVSGGAVTVRILDDQFKLPSIWPIDCFEMVQPRVPVNWALDVSEDLSLRFAPQAWLREGFWEDFFSDDPRALEDFRREVQVVGESDWNASCESSERNSSASRRGGSQEVRSAHAPVTRVSAPRRTLPRARRPRHRPIRTRLSRSQAL